MRILLHGDYGYVISQLNSSRRIKSKCNPSSFLETSQSSTSKPHTLSTCSPFAPSIPCNVFLRTDTYRDRLVIGRNERLEQHKPVLRTRGCYTERLMYKSSLWFIIYSRWFPNPVYLPAPIKVCRMAPPPARPPPPPHRRLLPRSVRLSSDGIYQPQDQQCAYYRSDDNASYGAA